MIFDTLKPVFTAIIILFLYFSPVHGQQDSSVDAPITFPELVEKAYGLDQDLMNGLVAPGEVASATTRFQVK